MNDPKLLTTTDLIKFMEESGVDDLEGKVTDIEEVPKPKLVGQMIKEFRCLTCGEPFGRDDCKITSKGVFVSVKRCPFCKSEVIVRQLEDGRVGESKYDVTMEEATFGPKRSKYAGLAEKKAFISGKIQRKKA